MMVTVLPAYGLAAASGPTPRRTSKKTFFLNLRPVGGARAAEVDDMGAGAVGVRLLVGADRDLDDVAVHRAVGHVEADVAAACAALLGADQRQVDGVGDKVGLEQQAFLFAFAAEVVG